MNPNEINKRIATACGVIPQEGYFCHHCGYSVAGKYVTFDERHDLLKGGCGGHLGIWSPRNYHGDLNAMHEAEREIKGAESQFRYAAELLKINGQGDLLEAHDLCVDFCWITATATAAQRAEAFLRTIGQWEDGK